MLRIAVLGVAGLLDFIVNAIVLWLAQKFVLPTEKEKGILSVAALALIGAVLTTLLSLIPLIGPLIALIVWIWLIKSWFDIGWGQAILIAIVAFILGIIASLILASLIGLPLLLLPR